MGYYDYVGFAGDPWCPVCERRYCNCSEASKFVEAVNLELPGMALAESDAGGRLAALEKELASLKAKVEKLELKARRRGLGPTARAMQDLYGM